MSLQNDSNRTVPDGIQVLNQKVTQQCEKLIKVVSTAMGSTTDSPTITEQNIDKILSAISKTKLYSEVVDFLAKQPHIRHPLTKIHGTPLEPKKLAVSTSFLQCLFNWRFVKAILDTPSVLPGLDKIGFSQIAESLVVVFQREQRGLEFACFAIANQVLSSTTIAGALSTKTIGYQVLKSWVERHSPIWIRKTLSPVLTNMMENPSIFGRFELLPNSLALAREENLTNMETMMKSIISTLLEALPTAPPEITFLFSYAYHLLVDRFSRTRSRELDNSESILKQRFSGNIILDAPRFVGYLFFKESIENMLYLVNRSGLVQNPNQSYRRSIQLCGKVLAKLCTLSHFDPKNPDDGYLSVANPFIATHFADGYNMLKHLYLLHPSATIPTESPIDNFTYAKHIDTVLDFCFENITKDLPYYQTPETSCIFTRIYFLCKKLSLGPFRKKNKSRSSKLTMKRNRRSGFF